MSKTLTAEVSGVPRKARSDRSGKEDAISQAANAAIGNVAIVGQVNDLANPTIVYRDRAPSLAGRVAESNCVRRPSELWIYAQLSHDDLSAVGR